MKLNITTAAELTAQALAQAKLTAHSAALATLSQAADAVTGPVPQAERDSWATKAAAAQAWIAGAATPGQIAMLEAECAVTGEAMADLATSITTKAAAYATFAAAMSGLRRTTTTAIDTATTPGESSAALTSLQATLQAMAGQGGAA